MTTAWQSPTWFPALRELYLRQVPTVLDVPVYSVFIIEHGLFNFRDLISVDLLGLDFLKCQQLYSPLFYGNAGPTRCFLPIYVAGFLKLRIPACKCCQQWWHPTKRFWKVSLQLKYSKPHMAPFYTEMTFILFAHAFKWCYLLVQVVSPNELSEFEGLSIL